MFDVTPVPPSATAKAVPRVSAPAISVSPSLLTLNTSARVKSLPIAVVELEDSAYHLKCVPEIDNAA